MIGICCSSQSAGTIEPYIVVCVSFSRVFSWHFYFSATLNVLSPKVLGPSVNCGESEKILPCKTFPVKPAGFTGGYSSTPGVPFLSSSQHGNSMNILRVLPSEYHGMLTHPGNIGPRSVSDACMSKENELTAVVGIPRPVSRPVTSRLNCTNYQIATESLIKAAMTKIYRIFFVCGFVLLNILRSLWNML